MAGKGQTPSFMRWTRKYTEGYQAKRGGKPPMGKVIAGLLTSPDYSFKAIAVNGYLKNQSLWKELMDIDLAETLRQVSVPYLILQGDTDIITSTKMIADFVQTAGNDRLSFLQVRNSGHMSGAAGMETILDSGFGFFQQRAE